MEVCKIGKKNKDITVYTDSQYAFSTLHVFAQQWKKNRGMVMSTGKPILPKHLFRFAAILSHGNIHVSTGGMVSTIENIFTTYGFQNYSQKMLCLMIDMFYV